MSDPILRLVRRQLRHMSPDAKVDLDQIKTVLLQEVLKRDVIEGEKAEDARKRVNRANKVKRVKVIEEAAPSESASAASAGESNRFMGWVPVHPTSSPRSSPRQKFRPYYFRNHAGDLNP